VIAAGRSAPTRRDLLRVAALAGGSLMLGFRLGADEPAASEFHPNAWLTLHPDGRIVFLVGRSEMGQGVRTSLPMIVAEELEVDPATITLEQAWPGCGFDDLGTGGSSSMSDDWDRVRTAGAAARTMLIGAAAARWQIDPTTCRAENGRVLGPGGRSLGYAELASEAALQPVPAEPALKPASAFRVVGTPRPRSDGPDIVTGRARYGLDVRLPGQRFAVVARPPSYGALLRSFDSAPALAVEGVEKVFPIDHGVAVVARSTWAALRGRAALDISWSTGEHVGFSSAAHRAALTAASRGDGITTHRVGEGREALAAAASRHEATYHYPYEAHAAIEPVNATAHVHDGRCEIWTPTQISEAVQRFVAVRLGFAPDRVDVHTTLLGGGFGRRLGWDMELEAAEIASKVAYPVQLFWSREDDIVHGYFQAASAHRLSAGLDAAGRIVAWTHHKVSTPHNARRPVPPERFADPEYLRGSAWGTYDTPYAFPAFESSYTVVDAPVPIGPWRAVFSPSSVFARESFLDELAERLGKDPVAWRLELLGANDPSVPPTIDVGSEHVDRRRLRRVVELAAARAGWGRPLAAGRARGFACNVFHTETYVAYAVEVALSPKPRPGTLPFVVERVAGAVDCGLVVNPDGARQQIESGIVWALSQLKTEVVFEQGRARSDNFDRFEIATLAECPEIDVELVASERDRPHGLGEPTVCPLAPAVASALSRLAGKRIRKLPVTATDLA